MRDIPVFTTEHGVAGLVLREIPYKQIAYITLHDTLQPAQLLRECTDFCRSVGASEIYATGHTYLETFPLHTEIWKMEQKLKDLPKTEACRYTVTEQNVEHWRLLYNEKMINVPNSATMTKDESQKHLKQGTGYFVYRDSDLLGIGIAAGEKVESVIGVKPGAGSEVLLALCGALQSDRVVLEVASANLPAVRLYKRLGFQRTAVLSSWYVAEKFS